MNSPEKADLVAAIDKAKAAQLEECVASLNAKIQRLESLNADKFAHLNAYRRAADADRATIAELSGLVREAVDKRIDDEWLAKARALLEADR